MPAQLWCELVTDLLRGYSPDAAEWDRIWAAMRDHPDYKTARELHLCGVSGVVCRGMLADLLAELGIKPSRTATS